jgi:bla regulator protein BlaR1
MPLSREFAASFGRLAANHLWQGFAAVAVLLALALKANHARARYWLWLAASVKFLVPFSVLAGIGASLGRWFVPATPAVRVPVVMQQIVQPFAPVQDTPLPAAASAQVTAGLLPVLLLALWFCGFVAALLYGWVRWRRVAAAVRSSIPLAAGRELEALWKVGQAVRLRKALRLVSSIAKLEPGVFGIFRPILWLPAGIGDCLDDAELEAILAHELCHIRRRDNLLSAIHMLVEALFWFHPLVWWLGARLEEQRERACDEEVVRMGSDPQIYAESILKVCEFYLASPVAWAAGVSGGELKKRIEGIMENRFTRKLSFGKRMLLALAAVLAAAIAMAAMVAISTISAPRSHAQSQAGGSAAQTKPVEPSEPRRFEVVSIKPSPGVVAMIAAGGTPHSIIDPSRVDIAPASMEWMIETAFRVQRYQVSGPDWLPNTTFSIVAKIPDGATKDQLPEMFRTLLVERFGLVAHRASKEQAAYALAVGKDGPRLKETAPDADLSDDPSQTAFGKRNPMYVSRGLDGLRVYSVVNGRMTLEAEKITLAELAFRLMPYVDAPVVDMTGLKGFYQVALDVPGGPNGQPYVRGGRGARGMTGDGGAGEATRPADEASEPSSVSIFASVQKLGLALERRRVSVERIVVDNLEKVPTEN